MEPGAHRVALVTGSAGGLGAAIAERLAKCGLSIAIVDIKCGEAVAGRFKDMGGGAESFTCDVTDPDAVARLGSDVETRFGQCDVLVDNASRYDTVPFDAMTFEQWRATMSLNLDGMFLTAKAFAPGMRSRGWGRIINIASNSCFQPAPAMVHYIASKSGGIGLARDLATELGPDGVTVNVVAPGPVVTDQLRAAYARDMGGGSTDGFDDFVNALASSQSIKRGGQPDDVTGVVAFLAGEESRFVTAQTIIVDGGWARA